MNNSRKNRTQNTAETLLDALNNLVGYDTRVYKGKSSIFNTNYRQLTDTGVVNLNKLKEIF